jgi:hypothetical protein
MDDMNNDIYAEYFTGRNVDAENYSEYFLPAYLEQVLPTDRDDAIL